MSLLCYYVIIMLCIVTFAPGPGAERTQHGSLLCFFLFFFLSRLCLNLFLHSFFALDSLSRACLGKRSFTSNVHYDDNNDDFNDRNGNVIMYIIMSLYHYYVIMLCILLFYCVMYRQLEPRSPRDCRAICCGAEKQHAFWRHSVVHVNDPFAKTG